MKNVSFFFIVFTLWCSGGGGSKGLREKNEQLEDEVKGLREKNKQLETDTSSQRNKIYTLQKANDQLYGMQFFSFHFIHYDS